MHVQTATADELASKVRVLCFVTTRPGYEDRAIAVNVTWLKRCTRHVFVTSSPLDTFRADEVVHLPNGNLNVTEDAGIDGVTCRF